MLIIFIMFELGIVVVIVDYLLVNVILLKVWFDLVDVVMVVGVNFDICVVILWVEGCGFNVGVDIKEM